MTGSAPSPFSSSPPFPTPDADTHVNRMYLHGHNITADGLVNVHTPQTGDVDALVTPPHHQKGHIGNPPIILEVSLIIPSQIDTQLYLVLGYIVTIQSYII